MKFVEPQVYLVAKTEIAEEELDAYLREIGAQGWSTDVEGAQKLVEVAGRICYKSFAPGLNPNVTKVRQGNAAYMSNILEQKHGSVMEHASVSFIFHNVSRIFTHELVRHRVGVAISQESMRYVRVRDIKMYTPGCEIVGAETLVQRIEEWYLEQSAKLDREPSFKVKKLITSALRRFLPGGICTTILWTSNLRNLRHVIGLRTALGAEEEIRKVFDVVASRARGLYPSVFQDFVRSPEGEWVSR